VDGNKKVQLQVCVCRYRTNAVPSLLKAGSTRLKIEKNIPKHLCLGNVLKNSW
jgi:hypothetical protein